MDIPINAEVRCADGPCGRTTRVIINPALREVTHLVVQAKDPWREERIVPIGLVLESAPRRVLLRCTRDELAAQERFIEYEYLPGDVPYLGYASEAYMMAPYFAPEAMLVLEEHQRIPPGELAIRRGAPVQAADGRVGQVDEFLVDPQDGHITHLVMRRGHLWGQKDVTLPVSEIDHIQDNTVYLRLDRAGVEALPAIPVRRRDDAQAPTFAR